MDLKISCTNQRASFFTLESRPGYHRSPRSGNFSGLGSLYPDHLGKSRLKISSCQAKCVKTSKDNFYSGLVTFTLRQDISCTVHCFASCMLGLPLIGCFLVMCGVKGVYTLCRY